jgi:hypothetical protein
MQNKAYANALAGGVLVQTGLGEVLGINVHNDHTSITDVTLDDSLDGSGAIKWKGRIAANSEKTVMLNDGKGRGITFSTGLYLTTSNVNDVDVQVYFT